MGEEGKREKSFFIIAAVIEFQKRGRSGFPQKKEPRKNISLWIFFVSLGQTTYLPILKTLEKNKANEVIFEFDIFFFLSGE